jgi:hypothetical protein
MSALPPRADIHYGSRNVSFVPQADIGLVAPGARQYPAFAIFNKIGARLTGCAPTGPC